MTIKIGLMLLYSILHYVYLIGKMEALLQEMNSIIKKFYEEKHQLKKKLKKDWQ
jgi:ubiquitin-protein ligase